MRVIQETEIVRSSREEHQDTLIEAIEELEQQLAEGVMEMPAYLIKKRALVRML